MESVFLSYLLAFILLAVSLVLFWTGLSFILSAAMISKKDPVLQCQMRTSLGKTLSERIKSVFSGDVPDKEELSIRGAVVSSTKIDKKTRKLISTRKLASSVIYSS